MCRSIVAIAVILLLLGNIVSFAQEDTAQANKALVQNAITETQSGNWQAVYDLFAKQYMSNPGEPFLVESSSDEVTFFIEMLRAGIPNLHIEAQVVIAQGDWVAAEIILTGTFTETLNFFDAELSPTGETVAWSELNFFRFEDGLVVEQWTLSDPMIMLGQLGMFPPEEHEDENPDPILESPAGYQALNEDELEASFASGLEDRNIEQLQAQFDLGLGVDDSAYFADSYVLWQVGVPFSITTAVQVEEDMAFTGMIATAMPDYTIETPVIVAEGDWIAALVNVSGTFTDDTNFFGMPLAATGEPIIWQLGMLYHYNADGKISEQWVETDTTSLFVGLGLMSMDEE